MANTDEQGEVATPEQIATLIQIYRSAVISGDKSLRLAAADNLAKYGIRPADLAVSRKANGGAK